MLGKRWQSMARELTKTIRILTVDDYERMSEADLIKEMAEEDWKIQDGQWRRLWIRNILRDRQGLEKLPPTARFDCLPPYKMR